MRIANSMESELLFESRITYIKPFSRVDFSSLVLIALPSVLKIGWSAGLAIVVAGALSAEYSWHIARAAWYTAETNILLGEVDLFQ